MLKAPIVTGSGSPWSPSQYFPCMMLFTKCRLTSRLPTMARHNTSPAIDADISVIQAYLEEQKIQTYTPLCQKNEMMVPARDLMAAGATASNSN